MELKYNNITLTYDYMGKGSLSFLLIHGVGANRTFFTDMMRHLSQHARVLNPDLRGHGESDKPDEPYSMQTYADDLSALVKTTKLDNIIVVGHSMGGNIALEFAAQHPDLVKGLVLLDAWLFWSESALAFFAERLAELKSAEFKEHLHHLADMRCFPTDRHKEQVLKSFLATPQYVWTSSLEKMRDWNKESTVEAVEACHVPILYVQTDKILVDLDKFQQHFHSTLILGKVIGTGHFCNLEVPDQVDAMIDRFVSTYIDKTYDKK